MHPIHPLQIQPSAVYFFILIVSFKAVVACIISVSCCPTWLLPHSPTAAVGLSCCPSGVSLPSHTSCSPSSSGSTPGDDSLLWGVGERLPWEHWQWDGTADSSLCVGNAAVCPRLCSCPGQLCSLQGGSVPCRHWGALWGSCVNALTALAATRPHSFRSWFCEWQPVFAVCAWSDGALSAE